jgi:hypothetical protein
MECMLVAPGPAATFTRSRDQHHRKASMATPAVAWFEIEHLGLTFAVFADPEGHVVGSSKGAVQ